MSTLLWVDDEQHQFESVRIICEDMFEHIESAQSAVSGYEMILDLKPDVILLDIILPLGSPRGKIYREAERLGRYAGLAIVQALEPSVRSRIIILSLIPEDDFGSRAAMQGIKAFSKSLLYDQLDELGNELGRKNVRHD